MNLRLWTLPPFVIVAGALAYLWSKFDALPQRYPVHWGVSGQADRFVDKSPAAVLMPGLIGLGVLALLAFNVWQVEKSARGGKASALWLALLEWMVALLFVVVTLLPLLGGLERGTMLVLLLAPTAIILGVAIKVSMKSYEAPAAPKEAWKFGVFYYNPADPDVMVPKRTGLGYTMNFARPASWWIIVGLVLLITIPLLVLR